MKLLLVLVIFGLCNASEETTTAKEMDSTLTKPEMNDNTTDTIETLFNSTDFSSTQLFNSTDNRTDKSLPYPLIKNNTNSSEIRYYNVPEPVPFNQATTETIPVIKKPLAITTITTVPVKNSAIEAPVQITTTTESTMKYPRAMPATVVQILNKPSKYRLQGNGEETETASSLVVPVKLPLPEIEFKPMVITVQNLPNEELKIQNLPLKKPEEIYKNKLSGNNETPKNVDSKILPHKVPSSSENLYDFSQYGAWPNSIVPIPSDVPKPNGKDEFWKTVRQHKGRSYSYIIRHY